MQTIEQIEEAMADVLLRPNYQRIVAKYEELLAILGNVDGNEMIALVLLAETIINGELE